jgi:hypothetical protein
MPAGLLLLEAPDRALAHTVHRAIEVGLAHAFLAETAVSYILVRTWCKSRIFHTIYEVIGELISIDDMRLP